MKTPLVLYKYKWNIFSVWIVGEINIFKTSEEVIMGSFLFSDIQQIKWFHLNQITFLFFLILCVYVSWIATENRHTAPS